MCGLVSPLRVAPTPPRFSCPPPKTRYQRPSFLARFQTPLSVRVGHLTPSTRRPPSTRFGLARGHHWHHGTRWLPCADNNDDGGDGTPPALLRLRRSSNPPPCRLVPRLECGANRGYPIPLLTRYAQSIIPTRLARWHRPPARTPEAREARVADSATKPSSRQTPSANPARAPIPRPSEQHLCCSCRSARCRWLCDVNHSALEHPRAASNLVLLH
jgi:hypothetical protein